jgi:hypothetical protein
MPTPAPRPPTCKHPGPTRKNTERPRTPGRTRRHMSRQRWWLTLTSWLSTAVAQGDSCRAPCAGWKLSHRARHGGTRIGYARYRATRLGKNARADGFATCRRRTGRCQFVVPALDGGVGTLAYARRQGRMPCFRGFGSPGIASARSAGIRYRRRIKAMSFASIRIHAGRMARQRAIRRCNCLRLPATYQRAETEQADHARETDQRPRAQRWCRNWGADAA